MEVLAYSWFSLQDFLERVDGYLRWADPVSTGRQEVPEENNVNLQSQRGVQYLGPSASGLGVPPLSDQSIHRGGHGQPLLPDHNKEFSLILLSPLSGVGVGQCHMMLM